MQTGARLLTKAEWREVHRTLRILRRESAKASADAFATGYGFVKVRSDSAGKVEIAHVPVHEVVI